MTKLLKRLRSNRGFTLAELMIAMMIMLMVTGIAAGGIPVAINAYTKVVDTANAQVLLSTTITKLREELGTADNIKIDGTTITYESENGSESRIYCVTKAEADADADKKKKAGINIREYADVVSDESDKTYEHLLISKSAANKNLYVTYSGASMDADSGILTLKGVQVLHESGGVLADLKCAENNEGEVKIRVLSYIY